ncbi:MAG: 4Fe-4S binding protein [Eubacteriales bacterium]
MTIQEIYEAFDKIGCLSFTTVNHQGEPESRIAHLRAYDDDGIYFMTMYTKHFYKHLKKNGVIALCGLCADTKVSHDETGMPNFEPGYAIRLSGSVIEVPIEEIKGKNNPIFDVCIKDQEKYPAMVVFCIQSAHGDIFNYDFETASRENKLERTYFAYNGDQIVLKGLNIDNETCISCGKCKKNCSFLAIHEENKVYSIDPHRCDECGDCVTVCPVSAISH